MHHYLTVSTVLLRYLYSHHLRFRFHFYHHHYPASQQMVELRTEELLLHPLRRHHLHLRQQVQRQHLGLRLRHQQWYLLRHLE
jgi:hypothetical protein